MSTVPRNPMTPGDLWFRVGLGGLLMIVALILQAGTASIVIFAVGVAWIAWGAFRAARQVRAAEQIRVDQRRRARGEHDDH